MLTRFFMRALCFIAIGIVAAGCGSAASTGFVGHSDLDTERSAEAASLSWPPGVAVPTFAPAPDQQQGKNVEYQVGLGASEADQAWFCAWSREWLDTRTADSTRASAALGQLRSITKLPIWSNLGTGQQDMQAALDKAALGDPAPITTFRQYFEC